MSDSLVNLTSSFSGMMAIPCCVSVLSDSRKKRNRMLVSRMMVLLLLMGDDGDDDDDDTGRDDTGCDARDALDAGDDYVVTAAAAAAAAANRGVCAVCCCCCCCCCCWILGCLSASLSEGLLRLRLLVFQYSSLKLSRHCACL